jgi:2-polyprenyl-6-methoxyphenol hydroxylase-like FAD-dependent oxidoreductase
VVFDLGILSQATRHPYRLQAEQWKLARLALAALEKEPTATIIMGAEVTGIAQDDDGVTVTIKDGSGERQLHSRYLVGADGARSVVRGAIGLEFEGQTYPETTLLVTTLFPFEEHIEGLTNVNYCWKAGGNFSLMRVPGRWRMSIYPREDVSIEEQITEKAIQAEMQNILPQPREYEVMDRRPYRIHKRIVAQYHRGRIALAGDAAHINSPSGGMGLNGGVHDAFELAAAMTDIRNGASAEQRLDLYERRRRPVALEQILEQADANRARMREKDPAKRLEILRGLQAIAADPARLEAHLMRTSMIIGLRQAAAVN